MARESKITITAPNRIAAAFVTEVSNYCFLKGLEFSSDNKVGWFRTDVRVKVTGDNELMNTFYIWMDGFKAGVAVNNE